MPMDWWNHFCDTVSGAIHSFEDFCSHVISTIGFTFVGIEDFIKFLGENGLNPIEVIPDLSNRASSKGADPIQVLEEVAGGILHEGWSGYSNRLVNQYVVTPTKQLLDSHTQQSVTLGSIHQTTLNTVQQKLLALHQGDGNGAAPFSGLLADQVDTQYTTVATSMNQLLASGDDPWQQASERQQAILQQTLALYDPNGQYFKAIVTIDAVILVVELVALVVVGLATEGLGDLGLGPLFVELDLDLLLGELLIPLIFWATATLANIVVFVVTEVEKKVTQQVQAPAQQQQQNTDPDPNTTPGPIIDIFPPDPQAPRRDKDDCDKGKVLPEATAFYGSGFVGDIVTEHPIYWCYILQELLDIDQATVRRFGGIATLEASLRQGEGSNFFKGAFFELQWLHDHLNSISSIEPIAPDGSQGPDALDLAGNPLEFKSVDSSNMSSLVDDWKKQLDRDVSLYGVPPHKIYMIFDASKLRTGKLPQSVLNLIASYGGNVVPIIAQEPYSA